MTWLKITGNKETIYILQKFKPWPYVEVDKLLKDPTSIVFVQS